jgi:hypothetical protein
VLTACEEFEQQQAEKPQDIGPLRVSEEAAAELGCQVATSIWVRKTPLFEPLIYQNDLFTMTGSGQP